MAEGLFGPSAAEKQELAIAYESVCRRLKQAYNTCITDYQKQHRLTPNDCYTTNTGRQLATLLKGNRQLNSYLSTIRSIDKKQGASLVQDLEEMLDKPVALGCDQRQKLRPFLNLIDKFEERGKKYN